MSAVECSCGRLCKSRSGFSTHARRCPVERARSDAFIAAVEQGRAGDAYADGERAAAAARDELERQER